MTLAGHAVIGLGFGFLFGVNPVISGIAALIPDVDVFWGWRKLKGRDRTLLNSHRGFTHHVLLVPVLFTLAFLLLVVAGTFIGNVALSFAVGYASHIFMDSLTPLGIPYKKSYYPRFSLRIYKTGSTAELVIVTIALVMIYVFTGDRIKSILIPSF